MVEEFNSISYDLHKKHNIESFDKNRLASWKNKNTIDYWRHERMYSNLNPIIRDYPDAKWLTIGDGRYGTDANYLISNGANDVLATDIAETYLKIAYDDGFISKYKIENAEALTFENNSFDFVVCKEAYHHFPRPMTALYEMIRVAQKAVILIEPQDENILIPSRFKMMELFKWTYMLAKDYVKIKIGRKTQYNYGYHEVVGNYVYTISERELEKVALGMNFEMLSFKSMNDHYIEGVEYEVATDSSELFQEVKREINRSDLRSKRGTQSAGILVAIIHKSQPDPQILEKLDQIGFVNRVLPRNPYC